MEFRAWGYPAQLILQEAEGIPGETTLEVASDSGDDAALPES